MLARRHGQDIGTQDGSGGVADRGNVERYTPEHAERVIDAANAQDWETVAALEGVPQDPPRPLVPMRGGYDLETGAYEGLTRAEREEVSDFVAMWAMAPPVTDSGRNPTDPEGGVLLSQSPLDEDMVGAGPALTLCPSDADATPNEPSVAKGDSPSDGKTELARALATQEFGNLNAKQKEAARRIFEAIDRDALGAAKGQRKIGNLPRDRATTGVKGRPLAPISPDSQTPLRHKEVRGGGEIYKRRSPDRTARLLGSPIDKADPNWKSPTKARPKKKPAKGSGGRPSSAKVLGKKKSGSPSKARAASPNGSSQKAIGTQHHIALSIMPLL